MKLFAFATLFTVTFFSIPAHASLYELTAEGHLLHVNALGELGEIAVAPTIRNYFYHATFDFNAIDPEKVRINNDGFTVYALNDGGNRYMNTATIWDDADETFNDIEFTSDLVEVEFSDNTAYDWENDPKVQFLGIEDNDPTQPHKAFDMVVFGFGIWDESAWAAAWAAQDYEAVTLTEFYLTLFFDESLFTGYDNLPTTINPEEILLSAGEFAARNFEDEIVGWAQILGDSVEVNPVPIPASFYLLGTGLAALIAIRRRNT